MKRRGLRVLAWLRARRILRPRLKDYLPTSLFGRALLIIVLPVALMQVAVTWAFFEAHWETVTKRLSESVAGDIAVVMDLYEQDPSAERLAAIQPLALRTMSVSIELEPDADLPTTVRSSFFSVLDRTLRRALADKIEHAFWFDTTRYPSYVEIRVLVDAGVLRLIVPRDRVFATTGHIFLIWIAIATLFLTAISVIYIRNQAKPIERLAAAAERFGRGQDSPAFRPSGAREVRRAAQAFIDMRRRIKRHIDQRTTLLASVSHDLRTPLTRLKLELALLPDTDTRADMRRDVEDMEAILNEYLAFAQGVGGEDPDDHDIADLTAEVVDGAVRSGDHVELTQEARTDFVAQVRAAAFKRCLANLIGNATRHGETVHVMLRRTPTAIEIDVDDDGPGIAPEDYAEAFRPFGTLDPARRASGAGVGLGLAIARDIAHAHGGDITLSAAPLGGLRARVRLPQERPASSRV